MEFRKTSRMDDMVSLFYLMIYLLNNDVLWVGEPDLIKHIECDVKKLFAQILSYKKTHSPTQMVTILSETITVGDQNL